MAVAIQWYTKLNYMAAQNFNIIIGGSIIKQEVFNELTPKDRQILLATAERGAREMDKIVMRDDAKAYATLIERGIEVVDLSPHQADWDAVARKSREQLAGRVYSKSLLAEVTKLASEK